jgi:hypothetical protein
MENTDIIAMANEKGLKVEFTDRGVASRSGNTIFMNKNLLKYPDYCTKTLQHEMRHSDNYTSKDILMDLTEPSLFDSLIFCFHHPKGFYQFIPWEIRDDIIYLDLTLFGVYIVAIGFIALIFILL